MVESAKILFGFVCKLSLHKQSTLGMRQDGGKPRHPINRRSERILASGGIKIRFTA
jgi:hypothetical protein